MSSVQHYAAVGFDMDHTLLRYRLRHFIKLIYQSTAVYLVLHRGYPQALFPDDDAEANYTYRYFFRAVFDHRTGDLLKIGADGLIMRGFHGFRQLGRAELFARYGPRPAVPGYHILAHRDPRFTNLHEFYGAAAVPLLARVVQLRAGGAFPALAARDFGAIMADVAAAFAHNLRVAQGELDVQHCRGYFFPRFLAHPRHYVHAVSGALRESLLGLRRQGKLVFVLSNSYFSVAERLLEEALGADWHEHFDFLVFSADKPAFFAPGPGPPLADLAGREVPHLGAWLARPRAGREKVLLRGHAAPLNAHFAALGGDDYKVLFFGDTIVSDCVYAFDRGAGGHWDCVLILEELLEIENGMCASEYYEMWKNWGSALHDRNVLGGVGNTAVFDFADRVAHRAFSLVDAPDCLALLSPQAGLKPPGGT